MKYTQILDENMVPEWRDQYLDYHSLNAALNRAIESKNIKSREKGVDLYFQLIKFNQKFANCFSRECQAQLDKINSFHKEKLNEMKGKYNNLQDQLDQIISSAIYREIQPDKIKNSHNNNNIDNERVDSIPNSAELYGTVTSITDLFKSIKHKIRTNQQQSINDASLSNPPRQSSFGLPNGGGGVGGGGGAADPESKSNPIFIDTLFSRQERLLSNASNSLNSFQEVSKKTISSFGRKLSTSIQQSAHRLSIARDNINSRQSNSHHSVCSRYRRSISSRILIDNYLNKDDPQQDNFDLNISNNNNNNTTSTSQSKKKIVASYKKKISQLKFAFKELYFNLVLFEQYTQLNYSGFEQILRKHDRMFASTLGRKFYQEHVQTADFYMDLQAIDHLIEGVEHIYTLHFENGNRRKAIEKLQVPTNVYKPSSPMLDFRVGYELGMFAVLSILVILVGLTRDTGYDWRTVFKLYRSPLLLIIFLFQSGISIVIWKHYKINHVLIFELNPRNNLSFQHFLEFGSLLGIIWSISVLFFLFSENLNIPPSICPLVVVVLIIIYLFNPTATFHYRARLWLLRILGRIFTAPLHPVRFADFWIADQLVSIVPLFLDLEYLSCFYSSGDLSVKKLSAEYASRCVTRKTSDLVIRTIVAALPAWFRCAQCLRRWRDENWLRLHLANAGKYFCMVSVVVLSSISQYKKSSFEFDTMRIIWMVAAIFTSSLTAWWDIIYDFGLFNTYDNKDNSKSEQQYDDDDNDNEKETTASRSSNNDIGDDYYNQALMKKKKKTYPFLRKELVYPPWVYYFAIVTNWILRFGWIITMSLTEFSGIEAGLVVSLLAPLEMFRRFVWNCIRLENEQLNNCGLFRAVRDIPIVVVAPIDESHLDKVIMMMDSRDGPSMRNRLMKRRTLRPDKVAFMILQQPDSNDNGSLFEDGGGLIHRQGRM